MDDVLKEHVATGGQGTGVLARLRLPEVWCKLALLAVFAAFYLGAADYPSKARQFPQLLAVISLALTIVSLVTDFTRKSAAAVVIGDVDDTELREFDAAEARLKRSRFYKAWAIIAVATAAGFLGGFLFCALLLFVGFALFFGPREKLPRNLAISVGVTAVIYLVFDKLMAVPLLDGILG